jgi:hypothetical protein
MYNRKTIQLYPKIIELVSLLWQAFPDPVLNQTLLYRIYGVGGGPDGGYGSLSVLMSHCRDKLNRIGVDVQPCRLEGRLARRLHFTDSSYLSIWGLVTHCCGGWQSASHRCNSDSLKAILGEDRPLKTGGE